MNVQRLRIIQALSTTHGIVLLYHSISDEHSRSENNIHTVSPNTFERHITDLSEFFRFVSLSEFLSATHPAGLACITFDDGYLNALSHALPILDRVQLSATMFVNTSIMQGHANWRDKVRHIVQNNLAEDFLRTYELPANHGRFYRISKDPRNNSALVDRLLDEFLEKRNQEPRKEHLYLTVDDLLAYSTSYKALSVGNHGARHYVLSSLSDHQQYAEINEPCQLLSQFADAYLENVFSIPFGGSHDINHATLEIAHEAGYSHVLMSRQQLHRSKDQSVESPRIVERFMPRSDDVIDEILQCCSATTD